MKRMAISGALQLWFSLIIEELIATDEKVAAVWREAVSALGESALITKAADEEDSLVSIGLKQQNTPFSDPGASAARAKRGRGLEAALVLLCRIVQEGRAVGSRWNCSGKSDAPEDNETGTPEAPLRF